MIIRPLPRPLPPSCLFALFYFFLNAFGMLSLSLSSLLSRLCLMECVGEAVVTRVVHDSRQDERKDLLN